MVTPEAVARALAEVENQLDLDADYYPRNLPPDHYARLTDWHSRRYGSRKVTDAGLHLPFDQLSPLARHMEIDRCHAEALLVHERLNEIIIDLREREQLVQRALGIIPSAEADRFAEIHSCPEFRPRYIAESSRDLVAAIAAIETELGAATALAYGLFVLAGLRARAEFATYGRKLDTLLDRITSAPSVIQTLNQRGIDGGHPGFEARFRLLVAVRERIWQLKPGRVAPDGFLLTKVIDAMLGTRPSVGNALGLAILDAIVISRFGFEVRYRLESGILRLEVMVENRSVYWEPTVPSPLSLVPIAAGDRLNVADIIALSYGSLATSYFTRGLWDKSLENYRRVLELKPESAETVASIGACHLHRGHPQEAIKTFEDAIRLDPEAAEHYHALGNAWAMMNQWPRAIDAYKKALKLRPDYVEALFNIGLAFRNAGQTASAVAAFEAAIELRPEYVAAHTALGNLHLENGRPEEAIRHHREAARFEPGSASAHYNLGQAYYAKGQLDHAIHAYQRAVDLNPKHAGAWHNLGIAYRDKGLKQKAVQALEKAVTLNPNLMR